MNEKSGEWGRRENKLYKMYSKMKKNKVKADKFIDHIRACMYRRITRVKSKNELKFRQKISIFKRIGEICRYTFEDFNT